MYLTILLFFLRGNIILIFSFSGCDSFFQLSEHIQNNCTKKLILTNGFYNNLVAQGLQLAENKKSHVFY